MAARRLVLNGLTAEVRPAPHGPPAPHAPHAPPAGPGPAGPATPADEPAEGGAGSPDSGEFYHELELYRQLLALPAPAPRRARTPDPQPLCDRHQEPPRRSRTPGARPPLAADGAPAAAAVARRANVSATT
ncbi:skin secretory protein xP2-like [Achroia grisella]|uniref:skin secretory protein xP2-like n=1 Tax=Achroia grisella TaxID=688607 RepID=UPI0027D33254|nr:skin secretory protein xP2-like [Achroia grisella]